MKGIIKSSGIILLLIVALISCKKDISIRQKVSNNTQNNNSPINTAPVAKAGVDIKIKLPKNFTILQGGFKDAEDNIKKVEWTKVNGPADFVIMDKDSLKTAVSNLKEGIYQFELTVTDIMGLYGKDTVTVEVVKEDSVGNNEIFFKNLVVICPWYNSLEVEKIHSYVPPGIPIKVFVQRDNASEWKEVTLASDYVSGSLYEYFIETRLNGGGIYNYCSLYIFYYGGDKNDRPNVKIQF